MNIAMRRRNVLAGLTATAAVSRIPAARPATPVEPFQAGVVTHFIQTADGLDHALDLIQQAGFTSLRDEVYWGLTERERGKPVVPDQAKAFVDGALSRGIRPLLTLDYGNPFWDNNDKPRSPEAIAAFAKFVGTVGRTFAGKVRDYEIWNEWVWRMGGTTPGSPEDYIHLFGAARQALREADPEARAIADQVVIGDANEALVTLIAASGFFRDLAGITVHPYFFNRGSDRTPEAWANWLLQADDLLRKNNGGVSVPLYVTEIGWPSHLGRYGVSRERQAAIVMRVFLLARTLPFVPGVWWYDLRDDGTNAADTEQNFGLVTQDLTAKPALVAAGQVNRLLAGAIFEREIATPDRHMRGLSFKLPDGNNLWAIWLTTEESCQTIRIRPMTDTVMLLSDAAGSAPFDLLPTRLQTDENGMLSLALTERPVFMRGMLARAEVMAEAGPRTALSECRS